MRQLTARSLSRTPLAGLALLLLAVPWLAGPVRAQTAPAYDPSRVTASQSAAPGALTVHVVNGNPPSSTVPIPLSVSLSYIAAGQSVPLSSNTATNVLSRVIDTHTPSLQVTLSTGGVPYNQVLDMSKISPAVLGLPATMTSTGLTVTVPPLDGGQSRDIVLPLLPTAVPTPVAAPVVAPAQAATTLPTTLK